ncbi:MAG: hypothetical protein GYA33_11070, partial [Thermogutta sp.]|nr:hypothetical protein [Thermogutta sp.]
LVELYETLDSLLGDLIVLSLPDAGAGVAAECLRHLLDAGGPLGPRNPANRPWRRIRAWNDPCLHLMGKAYPTWTDAVIGLAKRTAARLFHTVLERDKGLIKDRTAEAGDWLRRELLPQLPPLQEIRVYIERERDLTLPMLYPHDGIRTLSKGAGRPREWDLVELYETLDSLLGDLIVLSLPDAPVGVRTKALWHLLYAGGPLGPRNPANRPWRRLFRWNDPLIHLVGEAYPSWTDAAIGLANRMAAALDLGDMSLIAEEAGDWLRRELLPQLPRIGIEEIRSMIRLERDRTLALLQAEAAGTEAAIVAPGKAEPEETEKPPGEDARPIDAFLGGDDLVNALGIHPSRRDAFLKKLERVRLHLGDGNWREVVDKRPNDPRFLYRVKALHGLAAGYRTPKKGP